MEKTVEKKVTRKLNQPDDIKQLIDEDDDLNQKEISKPKKQKGPKTVIKENMITMKGDPLGLHVPLNEEPRVSLNVKDKVRTKDDIVVERYNPDVDQGLSTDEVELRQMAGLANITDSGSSKSISTIIRANIFTFFNFLNFSIAAWLISVSAKISNLFFMGVKIIIIKMHQNMIL